MNAPANENDVSEMQRQWAEAELNGDADALESLLDDDFTSVGPAGFILNKQGWVGRYRSGDLKNQEFAWNNASLRCYGDDTAIIVGEQNQQTTYQGNPVPQGQLRFTIVAVRRDGRWVGAAIHMSNIMQPPGQS